MEASMNGEENVVPSQFGATISSQVQSVSLMVEREVAEKARTTTEKDTMENEGGATRGNDI